jgi:hypothetical protein
MTIQHSLITDPNIHEPKGIASAASGKVYVADGSGSGTWTDAPVLTSAIDSGSTTRGTVLTADGTGAADFGELVWRDLFGEIYPRASGTISPTWTTFRSNGAATVDAYAFATNDVFDSHFHIDHDYALGTDMYLHLHWAHNGTTISGNLAVTVYLSYCKGHNQVDQVFNAPISNVISLSTPNIATIPQYAHNVNEIQITSNGGSSSTLDRNLLEPDGIILLKAVATTIPTITGGSPNEPFFFHMDLHYQASHVGTKNKAPNFYV